MWMTVFRLPPPPEEEEEAEEEVLVVVLVSILGRQYVELLTSAGRS